jgi:hypothetical protein
MASASTASTTSIDQATSFRQLCDMADLEVPPDDAAALDLIRSSGVVIPSDCDLAKKTKQVKTARLERACCLWLRSLIDEPECYLELSAPLATYAQGIYPLRAELIPTGDWARSLASKVAADMVRGDTPKKKASAGGSAGGAGGSAYKRVNRSLASAASSSGAAAGTQQTGSVAAASTAPGQQPVLGQQPGLIQQNPIQQNPFNNILAQQTSSIPPPPIPPSSSAIADPTLGFAWHKEGELLAIIPDNLRQCMFFADLWTPEMRHKYEKVMEKLAPAGVYENLEQPKFAHRLLLSYSQSPDMNTIKFDQLGRTLSLMLRFDLPEMHVIRSVTDASDADARDALQRRTARVKESWTSFLSTAAACTANTFADVSQLLRDLLDILRAKRQRLGSLLPSGNTATEEILLCTDRQIDNVGTFFDFIVPALEQAARAYHHHDRAQFINNRLATLLKPSVEAVLSVREKYEAGKDPFAQSLGSAMTAFGIGLPPPVYAPPPQVNPGAASAAALMPPPPPRLPAVALQQLQAIPPLPAAGGGQHGSGAGRGGAGAGAGGRGSGGSGLAGHGASGGMGKLAFLGRPVSAALVGRSLAVLQPAGGKNCCNCNARGTGVADPHFTWECPLKYFDRFGSCPGFSRDGSRIAVSWSGDDITAATKREWSDFIQSKGLDPAISARGAEVNFS